MSLDWESHRVVTRKGRFRALVFSLYRSVHLRIPDSSYFGARVKIFDSMDELEAWVRKRGWRLEKVKHFS